jgi:hypothetical protein
MQQTVRFIVNDSELQVAAPGSGKNISLRNFFAHLKPEMRGAKLWVRDDTVHLVLLDANQVFKKHGVTGSKLTLRKNGNGIVSVVCFASGSDKNCVQPGEVML